MAKSKKASEELTSRTSETKKKVVKVAEVKPVEKKAKFGSDSPKYFKNPCHIEGIGTCTGLVTEKMMTAFLKIAPKNINLDRWFLDFDPEQKRKDERKAKKQGRN